MSLTEKAHRKHPEYGLIVALICMALALVLAKYSRQQPLVEFHSSILSSVDVDRGVEVSCGSSQCAKDLTSLVSDEKIPSDSPGLDAASSDRDP
jgi:hypothetical protein